MLCFTLNLLSERQLDCYFFFIIFSLLILSSFFLCFFALCLPFSLHINVNYFYVSLHRPIQLIISVWPFWRNISKRSSCSRAFKRSAAIDDERRSSVGEAPSLPPLPIELVVDKFVAVLGCCGEIGGDDVAALVK